MFTFISIIVLLTSLFYLGNLSSTNNYDTSYIAPIITMFVYSLLSLVREAKKKLNDWDNYGKSSINSYGGYYSPHAHQTQYQQHNTYHQNNYHADAVEIFQPKEVKEKSYEKELIHYTTRSDVKAKIKQLETKRWFRVRRKIAEFFGFDITKKYYKCVGKTDNKAIKVVSNNTYFTTPYYNQESQEYNDVAKYVTRCCEIVLEDVKSNNT